jgi:hypothetical protein
MPKHKLKAVSKPYSPFVESFLIEYFNLKPNRYTQNDYLFTLKGQDYEVSYNPRCQLLDITPVSEDMFSDVLPFHAERITKEVNRLWEDAAFVFMLEYGRNIEEFLVARLYGLKSKTHPYITYLTKREDEWTEVENWPTLAQKYQARKIFQLAYYGSVAPPKNRRGNIKKPKVKANRRTRKVMPEYIVRLVKEQMT